MKFKIGDRVKIRKDVTLKEINNNYFNGCQYDTMLFLLEASFHNFNDTYIIKDIYLDKSVTLIANNISCSVNSVILENNNILDDKEKEYLRGVIKPFRKDVESITKMDNLDGKEYIVVYLKNTDRAFLPNFKKGTMYKNMKTNKMYALEELGL